MGNFKPTNHVPYLRRRPPDGCITLLPYENRWRRGEPSIDLTTGFTSDSETSQFVWRASSSEGGCISEQLLAIWFSVSNGRVKNLRIQNFALTRASKSELV
jgi:hypothetical protein